MFEGRIGSRVASWMQPRRSRTTEITWKRTQTTVWVATDAGRFLGMVEERDGGYVANDTVRGTYNTYRALCDAMQAFD